MDTSDKKSLWQVKTLDETLALYANWADSYEADIRDWGYATPRRIAKALKRHLKDQNAPILDFGCGTGLSGFELAKAGYRTIDGTDITPEMIANAGTHGVYRKLWRGEAGLIDVTPGNYAAITATGVISIGCAPPQTLRLILGALAPGGLLAFSYNDATVCEKPFMDVLGDVQDDGSAVLIFDEYGDHLLEKGMKSHVYILEKT